MADVQPEVVNETPIGGEQHPWRRADALRHGAVMQHQCVDRSRQLQPEEVAALWPRDPRARRKVAFDEAPRTLLPGGQGGTELAQMPVVSTLGQEVADSTSWPQWKPTSEFAAIRHESDAARR